MSDLACTPKPPYYAVIFSSVRTDVDEDYGAVADRMVELARDQPGFLGIEAARSDGLGITVSYWESEAAISHWRRNAEHVEAQTRGRSTWYAAFELRVARVERVYGFQSEANGSRRVGPS